MTYIRKKGINLLTFMGFLLSLIGIVLYDPFGALFRGTGLIVISIGLICVFFGYKCPI